MSGSGSEALLRSFKESQTKSKLKERRMQIKKEGNVDDGSPGSSIGGIELDHIAIKRDLEPSNDQTLTIHERVGGSSIPPDDRSGEELIPSALRSLEEEVVIKAEDIRAEMSNTTSKAGKRKSTGTVVGVETIKGVDEGRVMTRGKKARLSQAAAKEEVVPLDEAVMILGRSGPIPWVEKASTPTTTTTQQVNGTYESADWRDEAYDARDSLPGYPTAGPSNPHARLSFAGPSSFSCGTREKGHGWYIRQYERHHHDQCQYERYHYGQYQSRRKHDQGEEEGKSECQCTRQGKRDSANWRGEVREMEEKVRL